MSKRIVLTTIGSLGDLHPYLALGLGLRARGHRAALATCEFYRGRIEALGLEFCPVRPHLSPEDEEIVKLAIDVENGPENIFRRFVIPSLRESYEDLMRATEGADLLVTHPLPLMAPLVAEKRKLRWASAVLSPMSFLSVHDPIEISGYPVMSLLMRGPLWLRRMFMGLGRIKTRSWVKPVDAFRAELGLPPGGHPLFEGQHSPHRVLALFSQVLAEPRPDWPPRVTLTGFCFHDRKEGHDDLSPELSRFLDAGPAPLVFTLGSSAVFAAGLFYEESAAAARALGFRAVLLTGSDPRNRPAAAGPDLFAGDYAPFSRLFPRARAIVHPGGIGTAGQALRSGRPMLVVPYGNDQPDNAARCRRLGVARVVPRTKYDRTSAARELTALLDDPSAETRGADAARRMAGEDGVRSACDALEMLLGG